MQNVMIQDYQSLQTQRPSAGELLGSKKTSPRNAYVKEGRGASQGSLEMKAPFINT